MIQSICMHKKAQAMLLLLLSVYELCYLWFQVPVYHPYVVHVTDSRHKSAHDAAGLRFTEMLLPADPLQQLPSAEQLQNQVSVELQ